MFEFLPTAHDDIRCPYSLETQRARGGIRPLPPAPIRAQSGLDWRQKRPIALKHRHD